MKVMHLLVTVFFLFISTRIAYSAQTYFVSSSLGSDSNNGLSESSPWKTVEKVDNSTFLPGDSILFRRGDTFNQPLHIEDSGEANAPIVFGSYGKGKKPVINATETPYHTGHYRAAIWVDNSDYIVIDSLEITGNKRYGIRISSCNNLTIQNSYIHHISTDDIWHCIVGGGKDIKILNNEIAYCGYEAFYGNTENIEIGNNYIHHIDMYSETNNCTGGGDGIHLNCWSPNYWVHHNVIDHSTTCGPKGAFVSSHCTLACLDNEQRCTDDIATKTSNGVFEHNTVISGPNDNFGFTNAGYGDIVRYNSFFFEKEKFTAAEVADFGLKSEHGVIFHHNIVDGYGSSISLGKDGSIFTVYNNLFVNSRYSFWGTTDTRSGEIYLKNNLFIGPFQHSRANSNQVFTYSYNVSTVAFQSGTSGSGTMVDQGNNTIYSLEQLMLKNPENRQFQPLSSSPIIEAGTYVGLPHNGSAPNIGPYNSAYFAWPLFLPGIINKGHN